MSLVSCGGDVGVTVGGSTVLTAGVAMDMDVGVSVSVGAGRVGDGDGVTCVGSAVGVGVSTTRVGVGGGSGVGGRAVGVDITEVCVGVGVTAANAVGVAFALPSRKKDTVPQTSNPTRHARRIPATAHFVSLCRSDLLLGERGVVSWV